MKPGRNDPCPCASGRKYKHCCGKAESNANPLLRLLPADAPVRYMPVTSASLTRAEPWEADLAPVLMFIASDPEARPAALVIATRERVLRCDLIAHPPAEAEAVATLIAGAIARLIEEGAAPPSVACVRHAAVAEALRAPLHALGVPLVADDILLANLDEFLVGLRAQMSAVTGDMGALSQPVTWAAWGFDAVTQSSILDAAAAFHRARPWTGLTDSDIISIEGQSEHPWYACVLGNAGEACGLAIYEDVVEIAELLDEDTDRDFSRQTGANISLLFNARSELPPEMRKELTNTGRYAPTEHAWPSLMARNTIGGGISRTSALEFARALDSIPRFAAWLKAHEGQDVKGGLVWTDDVTGTTHSLLDVTIGRPPLWSLPDRPLRALPRGEQADPRARVDSAAGEVRMQEDLSRLERYLAAERAAGAPAKRVADDEQAISLFMNMTSVHLGVPLRAFSERDLRVFLYDTFPRKVMSAQSMARGLRSSLRRFFAWMAANEGLSYPWAGAVLRDRQAFDERVRTFPGGHLLDPSVGAWMAELYDDLSDRLMEPDVTFKGVGEWGARMGIEEATLHSRLATEWMIWREEFLRVGVTQWVVLAEALSERQRKWETTPQAALGGKSPAAVVKRERLKRGR